MFESVRREERTFLYFWEGINKKAGDKNLKILEGGTYLRGHYDILMDIRPKLNVGMTFIMASSEFLYTLNWTLFAIIVAAVKDIFPKKSPSVQVGLKISTEMSAIWDGVAKLEKMKTKLGTIKEGNYTDENKDILKEIGADLEEVELQFLKFY